MARGGGATARGDSGGNNNIRACQRNGDGDRRGSGSNVTAYVTGCRMALLLLYDASRIRIYNEQRRQRAAARIARPRHDSPYILPQ